MTRNRGFDDFLDYVEDGEPMVIQCSNGHKHTPPQTRCRICGDDDFEWIEISNSGEIVTYTVTYVASHPFSEITPYAVVIADMEDIRLTGIMPDIDNKNLEIGTEITLGVYYLNDDKRVLRFDEMK